MRERTAGPRPLTGRQLWEVDKRNQKFVIDGVDYWADVRRALGE